ncbi:MAG: zinc-finger domain-containing protein [Gammaproteobacteria bacterium]|nr:zinc-finger domain-containing protein [Gammaproteobacteria bacterium]
MAQQGSEQRVTSNMERRYTVSEKDLPVSCPLPWTVRWNSHPRVYLPLEPGTDATCPYCGAVFSLASAEPGDRG